MIARRTLRLESLESRTAPSLTPVGTEFQVNTVSEQRQWYSSIATSASGQFVAAFSGFDPNGPGTHWGVYCRRFEANGMPIGNQVLVSETPGVLSREVSVGADATGGFVVVWLDVVDYTGSTNGTIRARRFDHNGIPLGSVIVVTSPTSGDVYAFDAAVDASGNFAITWVESPWNSQTVVRRYLSDGTPVSEPVVLDQGYTNNAAITIAPNGVATVVWDNSVSTSGVWLQQIASTGALLGSPIRISQLTDREIERRPDIVAMPDNSLVAAYGYHVSPFAPAKVAFRRLSSSSIPLENEVDVPSGYALQIREPSIAVGTAGRFTISYTVDSPLVAQSEIRIQDVGADGLPTLPPVVVSSSDSYYRCRSSIAINSDGDGFAVWDGGGSSSNSALPGPDGSSFGVFARRFVVDLLTITEATVNDWSRSRSSVTSTSLTFSLPIILPTNPANAFTLTGPAGTIPVSVDSSASTPAGANLKLTFPTYPSGLPNGRYTLRGLASQIHDTAGQALDGNGDGVPGDDYVMNFHRLAGDFDGDGTVATSDFILFRFAFGSNDLTFDLDGDGTVNASDFVRFRLTFGSVI